MADSDKHEAGIFASPGTQIVIPAGGLKVDLDRGEMTVEVKLYYDVAAHWLQISLVRTREAQEARKAFVESGNQNYEYLGLEFNAAVSAVVAIATFFDAIYAQCKSKNPSENYTSSQKRKPKRPAVVAEQIRRVFKIEHNRFRELRPFLIELYELRDLAVHPSHDLEIPVMDERINRGVSPIFLKFNSKLAVCYAQQMISVLEVLMEKNGRVAESTEEWKQYLRERYLKLIEPYTTRTELE
ncbi:hypothetical protein C0431_03975 [bacterium]|nr:hypothetical protein [bacterium]